MKMTAVRIDAEAYGDQRFVHLARLLGMANCDGHFALIKVSLIWSWQIEHYTPEAPCFVVPSHVIEMALGESGPAAMVRAQLAEEVPEGFRIRGANHERAGWLYQLRQKSALGGAANRAKVRKEAHKKEPPGPPQESLSCSLFSVSQSQKEERVPLASPPAHPPAEVPDPEPGPKPAPETVMPCPEPSGSGSPEAQAKPGPRPAKLAPHPGHQQAIDAFWRGFEGHAGVKPTYTADVGAHVKRLLASHGTDEVLRRIGNFFSRPPGQWPEERDFGTFVRFFDKWAVGAVPMNVPMPRRSKPL